MKKDVFKVNKIHVHISFFRSTILTVVVQIYNVSFKTDRAFRIRFQLVKISTDLFDVVIATIFE